MTRYPWLKWYPADWRQEPTLRMCSRAARALWLDLIGLMHEAEPYGHLLIKGKPPTSRQLAAVLGDTVKSIDAWLGELERNDVFSRTAEDVIYSRRMLRDRARADHGAESAQRRWAPSSTSGPTGGGEEGGAEGGVAGGAAGAPNGLPNGSPIRSAAGSGGRPPNAQKPHVRCQTSDATRQTQEAKNQESDSDSDSESHENEGREDAGADGGHSGASAAAQFVALPDKPRKQSARADKDLAEHMIAHGHLDAGAVWVLVMAARDPREAEHAEAARQCEAYSKRHRLGWFVDETPLPGVLPGVPLGSPLGSLPVSLPGRSRHGAATHGTRPIGAALPPCAARPHPPDRTQRQPAAGRA